MESKRWKHSKPYWDDDLNDLWKLLKISEHNYAKCKIRREKQNLFNIFKSVRKSFDRRLRQKERQYLKNQAFKIEECNTSNPREFWKYIKRLGPQQKRPIPVKVHDGVGFNCEPEFVLNKWKDDFQSLYNPPNTLNFDDEFYNNITRQQHIFEENITNTNDMVNSEISFDEIQKLVYKSKNNKAVGIDNIPYDVLKNHTVILAMWKLFKCYFKHGLSPSIWAKAMINPIPKSSSKDPYNPLQYRGISLLSCTSKIYSGLLNARIAAYCEFIDIFVEEQNGFRRKRSCEDHIYVLTSIINSQFESKKPVFAAFVDMEKAFDWVNRDLLLYRLLQYNIDGKMYKAIKNMYAHTESCIKLNNMMSGWFSINSGVRQGDPISPTLFSLYINELAKDINNLNLGIRFGNNTVSILLYADDLILLSSNEENLQIMLNKMLQWCRKWRLKVNESKTKIVHFRNVRKCQTKYKFIYDDKILNVVTEYKYLGVIFDEHMTFTKCSKTLADSGSRALGAIWSKFKCMKDVGYKTYCKMYESGVVSVLDYGSGIWSKMNNLHHSEIIQNKAIRYFLGLHNFTATAALQGEMGWLPCKYRKMLNTLRFWNRLIKMPSERLTKQIFNTEYNNDNPNSWTSNVKHIFEILELSNVYEQKSTCNLDLCKDKLFLVAEQEWKIAINSKPKLRTYIKFKKNFHIEPYIKITTNRYERSLLAKLRCGILQLHIETGRFNQTKLEDRKCNICNNNEVEDEYHFVCVCKEYDNERQILFQNISFLDHEFSNLTSVEKFNYILNLGNKYVLCYLDNCWKKRISKLYNPR